MKRALFALLLLLWLTSHAAAQCEPSPLNPYGTNHVLPVYTVEGTYDGYLAYLLVNPYTAEKEIVVIYPDGAMVELPCESCDEEQVTDAVCNSGGIPNAPRRVPPASGSAKFTSGSSEAWGQATQGVATGDFNGDGIPDTAVVGGSSVTVTLYSSAGATLATHFYGLPSTSEPGIVAADFNGDGKLDLAVLQDPIGTAKTGSVALLLGNGDGTFAPAVTVPVGVYPQAIALGDFNGDGKPDLVIEGGSLAVLLGDGGGTFQTLPVVPFASTQNIAAVDINGDGKLDLIAAVPGPPGGAGVVAVYPGNGDGTFKAPISSTTGASSLLAGFAYADLNNDGKLDYLIVDSAQESLFVGFGNGDGTFQASRQYVAPANAGTVGVIPLEDGNAIFLPDRFAQGVRLIFADTTGAVSLPEVQTVGMAKGEYIPSVSTADVNGDKKPDLVYAEATGIAVELGNGDGTFAAPVVYATTGAPVAVSILDLNGDGVPDLFVTQSSGANVFLNSGNGAFAAGVAVNGGPFGKTAVADFNGDGKPDVAVLTNAADFSSETLLILLSKGDGTFEAPPQVVLPTGNPATAIATADFNGDGKPDLVVSYPGSNGLNTILALYLGKGDGTFETPSIPQATGAVVAAGDLNGDGKPDLVSYDYITGVFAVSLGNGDGTFRAPMNISTGVVTTITIADLNGDGKPDLVMGDCCGNAEASYMLGNGDGTFGAQTYFLSGPNPNSLAVADFDGSGRAGIAIAGEFGYSADTPMLVVMATSFPLNAAVVSAAYPQAVGLAPGMLAAAYGTDVANATGATTLPLPVTYLGTSVSITDSSGAVTAAPLLFVSPGQVNFEVPLSVATGAAQVNIISGDGTLSSENVEVTAVVPGVFALNPAGLAAADVLTVSGSTQTYSSVYTVTGGSVVAAPINVSSGSVYLILYGTGFQAAGTAGVTVTIGGVEADVGFAGMQGSFAGLDQANVLIPASLAGRGEVAIQLTANGVAANATNVTIR
jgi:uncharacterized protein (TIGR03437 family)